MTSPGLEMTILKFHDFQVFHDRTNPVIEAFVVRRVHAAVVHGYSHAICGLPQLEGKRCEVLGQGCRMCSDCRALWGKFVNCNFGRYKSNRIGCFMFRSQFVVFVQLFAENTADVVYISFIRLAKQWINMKPYPPACSVTFDWHSYPLEIDKKLFQNTYRIIIWVYLIQQ